MILESQNKKIIIRRAILGLMLLAIAVIQNTDGLFPQPFGVRASLLIPAVVCVAMFERDMAGMFFGLFAGALWDTYTEGADFNALYLFIAGFVCGTLINTIMRNNIVTAALLSGFFIMIHPLIYWLFHYVFAGLDNAGFMFLRYYLPGMVYTAIFIPFMFIAVRAIEKKFSEEE